MPKITNPKVIEILWDPFFQQHSAMHLARERVTLPDGSKLPMILPPCACGDCGDDDAEPHDSSKAAQQPPMPGMTATGNGAGSAEDMASAGMTEAGLPGSGKELLEMHHQMIRVFRYFLEQQNLKFQAEWNNGEWRRPKGNGAGYAPQLWGLDHPDGLPPEVKGTFSVTDPGYLDLVFKGVQDLVNSDKGSVDEAVDALGRFIERGVKGGRADGSGFHDTVHEYLAAREGRAAQGAELNRLNASRFNDYFWGLHLWMDGQYGRLLEYRKQPFDTTALNPAGLDMCTGQMPGGTKSAMTMSMGKEAP